jgi:hypothetical protein
MNDQSEVFRGHLRLHSGGPGTISSMKWVIAIALLGCVSCGGTRVIEEGFESPVGETTDVYVGQGQRCLSDEPALSLARKYPARLPVGVSIKAVSSTEYALSASVDAPKNQPGLISNGIQVSVSEPATGLQTNCETMTIPI